MRERGIFLKPFTELSREGRAEIVRMWAHSSNPLLLKVFGMVYMSCLHAHLLHTLSSRIPYMSRHLVATLVALMSFGWPRLDYNAQQVPFASHGAAIASQPEQTSFAFGKQGEP